MHKTTMKTMKTNSIICKLLLFWSNYPTTDINRLCFETTKFVPLVNLFSVLDITECLLLYLNSPPPFRILRQLNHFHTLKQHLVEIYLIKFLPPILSPPLQVSFFQFLE